ncbi:MAG: hypothetical protein WA324_27240 [Bryobacteraceae bacterium]
MATCVVNIQAIAAKVLYYALDTVVGSTITPGPMQPALTKGRRFHSTAVLS